MSFLCRVHANSEHITSPALIYPESCAMFTVNFLVYVLRKQAPSQAFYMHQASSLPNSSYLKVGSPQSPGSTV